jgi:hypothetical protein
MKKMMKKPLAKAQAGKQVMKKTADKTVSKVTSPSGNYKTTTKTFTSPNKEGSVTKISRTVKGMFAGAPTVEKAKQNRTKAMDRVERENKRVDSANAYLKRRQNEGTELERRPERYKTVKDDLKLYGDFKKGGSVKSKKK